MSDMLQSLCVIMMIQRQKKIRPVFHEIPKWMGAYLSHGLTTNSPEFHYYSARDNTSQPVTLFVSTDNSTEAKPITMYYNIQSDISNTEVAHKDESNLKDFSYLNVAQKQEHEKITLSKEQVVKESSWVRKYEPRRFMDLITDELINRNVLSWMKSWDEIVFKKKPSKVETTNAFFRRGNNNNRSNFVFQEFNYKKLILLAGPPGCGKTTLARVLAKHCGYHWEEINASDDRTAKALISKIDSLVTNKTVGRQQKPVCVIIDEVDGALDSDSNGIKDVLHYLETGVVGGEVKKEKVQKPQRKNKIEPKVLIQKGDMAEIQKQQRKTKIDRPVIFICNDPYVHGLKELRGKALVVYFNQLHQDRVVKRLKEITENEGIYIETELLSKICEMCNNDVRSSVGVLELLVGFKKQQGIAPKDMLNRLKFSFSKDTVTSTNEFLQKLNSSKINEKGMLTTYHYALQQHGNPSLLFQTFCHNLYHHRQVFLRFQAATRLYRQLIAYDIKINENHGQTDEFAMMPYLMFRVYFKPDQLKRIQFPSIAFEKRNKQRSNYANLQKILEGIPCYLRIFTNKEQVAKHLIYLLWLTMQTGSTKEEDILRCVYKMLTYGFKLAPRGSPHIFNPELEQFLTYAGQRPEVALSHMTRTLMDENYQFLKLKNQLIVESFMDGRQSYENVINQLKKNRRRNRQLRDGMVKYKYLEGTGTQIKYDLKIGSFFQQTNV